MSGSFRADGAGALGPSALTPRALPVSGARSSGGRVSLHTLLLLGVAGSATALMLAACSATPNEPASGTAALPARHEAKMAPMNGVNGAGPNRAAALQPGLRGQGVHATLTRLAPPSQSIIQTASLTLRVKDVTAQATAATNIVAAVAGYVSGEQRSTLPAAQGGTQISLQLKIPFALYRPTIAKLQALGTQLGFSSQAIDVTQQVADVSSRVASAQAAITQLRALLKAAGNVSGLLSVQNEINSQESDLESLIAQQAALAHETTYATVSVLLVGHHAVIVKKQKKKTSHGFVAGLKGGWRALVDVVSALLTALGAALPFIIVVVAIGGIVIVGRRRAARRKAPAATDPPSATA